jgi:hypothetical protein
MTTYDDPILKEILVAEDVNTEIGKTTFPEYPDEKRSKAKLIKHVGRIVDRGAIFECHLLEL